MIKKKVVKRAAAIACLCHPVRAQELDLAPTSTHPSRSVRWSAHHPSNGTFYIASSAVGFEAQCAHEVVWL